VPAHQNDAATHQHDAAASASHAPNADTLPNDETRSASRTILSPADWQSFSAFEERPDQEGTDRDNRQEDRATPPFPQAAAAPPGSGHGNGAPAAGSAVVGEFGRMIAHPPEHQTPSPATAPSVTSAHWTGEEPLPVPSRSVSFEVMHPDIGRVNVRVAVTHDLVHTYIVPDRPEVGHFLMNGQDRLQSALQNSGLDLGQFRVDIERQSAGRSFHQGHQHGQNEPSGQDSARSPHDRPSVLQDNRVLRHRGSLNLVA
jgi:hypothetical protein